MKKHLFLLALLSGLGFASSLSAQNESLDAVLSGESDPATASAPVRADKALITVNGSVWNLVEGQELQIQHDTKYDVAITQLQPNSRVYIEVLKAGVVVGRQSFNANQSGEFKFEYKTPGGRAQGEARIKYTSSSGKVVTILVKVKMT